MADHTLEVMFLGCPDKDTIEQALIQVRTKGKSQIKSKIFGIVIEVRANKGNKLILIKFKKGLTGEVFKSVTSGGGNHKSGAEISSTDTDNLELALKRWGLGQRMGEKGKA